MPKEPLYPHVPKSRRTRETVGCKGCVTWLLLGMTAAEALEHNAIVSGTLRDVGKTIKAMVNPTQWEDIICELDWFEHPISEPIADMAILNSLDELEKKCGLDVSKARQLRLEGYEANKKGRTILARARYIELKDELVRLGGKLSCIKD